LAARISDHVSRPVIKILGDYTLPDAASQLALSMANRQLVASGAPLPSLKEVGFKAYSQTDEDGILLFIFSVIGITNKKCVEICAGEGIECNTANLIINHGWHGLLFDGSPELIQRGNAFYKHNKATFADPPALVCSWIKRDTINELIGRHEFKGEIDLLSLDLDGVDYWIWEALEVIMPRVVVVEYLDIAGPERSVTVPYEDDFDARKYPMADGLPNFMGASLPAFVKLAHKKGYRFVGCNRSGYNAFFVRKGIADQQIPEIPITEFFEIPKVLRGMRDRWPSVAECPWVQV
jgi:hypothetical protein